MAHAIDEPRKSTQGFLFHPPHCGHESIDHKKTMLKLIDCSVNPVAMYSCQIWLPFSPIMKETTKPNCYYIPQCASKDAFESTHLKMLKCNGCLVYTRK